MLFAVSPCDSGTFHAVHSEDLVELVEQRMLELIDPNGRKDDADRSDSSRAAAYHLASGGQRVRARLALSSGKTLGLSDADSISIASCVELLHNASLIHDDLQDGEQYRRGIETVCAAYGKHIAICTGDLLLSAAYAALSYFSNPRLLPRLMSLVHERTSVVISGQCAGLTPTGNAAADMALYEKIAAEKSGSLLSLPIELALVGAGKHSWVDAARRAADHFAVGYQIVDDMEDVAQDTDSHAVNAVLVLKASEQGDLQRAVSKAREYGLRHLTQAISGGGSLPGGSGDLLQELAQKLRDRL
jgi:geranylgeranyl pyrophosphate synthase